MFVRAYFWLLHISSILLVALMFWLEQLKQWWLCRSYRHLNFVYNLQQSRPEILHLKTRSIWTPTKQIPWKSKRQHLHQLAINTQPQDTQNLPTQRPKPTLHCAILDAPFSFMFSFAYPKLTKEISMVVFNQTKIYNSTVKILTLFKIRTSTTTHNFHQ